MSDTEMLRIAPADRHRAFATLTAAAADDATVRWMFPDDEVFTRVLPGFIAAVAGDSFENGTAWELDEFAAVALLWDPASGPDFEDVSAILRSEVDPAKHGDLFDYLEKADNGHPRYQHWSVATFGVDPVRIDDGAGDRLFVGLRCLRGCHGPPVLLRLSGCTRGAAP
jgi:hypothetical protein